MKFIHFNMSVFRAVLVAAVIQLGFSADAVSPPADTIAQVRYPHVAFFSNERYTNKEGTQALRLLLSVHSGECTDCNSEEARRGEERGGTHPVLPSVVMCHLCADPVDTIATDLCNKISAGFVVPSFQGCVLDISRQVLEARGKALSHSNAYADASAQLIGALSQSWLIDSPREMGLWGSTGATTVVSRIVKEHVAKQIGGNKPAVCVSGLSAGFSTLYFLAEMPSSKLYVLEEEFDATSVGAHDHLDAKYPGRLSLAVGLKTPKLGLYMEGRKCSIIFIDRPGSSVAAIEADLNILLHVAAPGAEVIIVSDSKEVMHITGVAWDAMVEDENGAVVLAGRLPVLISAAKAPLVIPQLPVIPPAGRARKPAVILDDDDDL